MGLSTLLSTDTDASHNQRPDSVSAYLCHPCATASLCFLVRWLLVRWLLVCWLLDVDDICVNQKQRAATLSLPVPEPWFFSASHLPCLFSTSLLLYPLLALYQPLPLHHSVCALLSATPSVPSYLSTSICAFLSIYVSLCSSMCLLSISLSLFVFAVRSGRRAVLLSPSIPACH